MKKLCTYSGSYHVYDIPYSRVANIYESEEPVFKGCTFEVSTHTGGVGVEWEFKPFKTIQEAQAYALGFVAPPHIVVSVKPE